ncbi:hypothetical protein [Actinomycetospora atypica]|uniref:MYXO-CTERM domain-containing protein n=1 Tax=Actinomycetospora atypica TaxID=1290095 RepID=A0ABV9YU47_9PSEU
MGEDGYDPRSWSSTPGSPLTVHADADEPGAVPVRRRRDPLALLVGLVCLAVAGLAMASPPTLVGLDPRWVLAGAAVVVGVGALLATVRRRS